MCSCLSLSVFRQSETHSLLFCLVGFAPVTRSLVGPPIWQAHSPGHMVPVLPVCDSLKRKEVFLGVTAFAQSLQKNIFMCVYIYIIINHLCPWESLEWIENLFHCNIDCIEAHCLSTEETKRLCITFWYYVPPLLFWSIHVLKLYSI